MSITVTTYNDLQLYPYKLIDLLELKIVKKINEHVRLYFTGVVPEEIKDSYIGTTNTGTHIEVNKIDENQQSKPIFKGIIVNIGVKVVRGVYYIEAEAVSYTYNLDVQFKSRSFQNKAMTYKELIQQVVSDYPGADFIDTVSKGDAIKKFIMQYKETDWQFLKRMASHFNAGLIADPVASNPKFWFGVPESGEKLQLEELNYTVSKRLSEFRNSSQNHNPKLGENDFVYYEFQSDIIMNIGSSVEFNGKSLVVYEATCVMEQGILKNNYVIAPAKGLSQDKIYNNAIVGLSVEGKVISVANDNIKAHLAIDSEQSVGTAWWFPYSSVYTAEGNSGWYCMPELNDHIRIYFPSNKEEDGVAISSVRKDTQKAENNKIDNPDIKYFRTKSGKELMFGPEEILISAKDGEIFIKLNENNGIEIYSKYGISLTSKDMMTIHSDTKVIIKAEELIEMTCQSSNITMDGTSGDIIVNGSEVKSN